MRQVKSLLPVSLPFSCHGRHARPSLMLPCLMSFVCFLEVQQMPERCVFFLLPRRQPRPTGCLSAFFPSPSLPG